MKETKYKPLTIMSIGQKNEQIFIFGGSKHVEVFDAKANKMVNYHPCLHIF